MLKIAKTLFGSLAFIIAVGAGAAQGQQSGRIFPFKWTGTFPADDITTADVQHALIWTKQYWGNTDGALGPMTRKAIRDWLLSKGYPPAETLTNEQAVELVSLGLRQRDAFGWALLRDDAVGFSVGIPTKLSTSSEPERKDGALNYSAYGPVGHFVGVFPNTDGCASMEAVYELLSTPISGQREVSYKARKDDWFVVSGTAGDRGFYRRTQCRPQGIVTVVINTPIQQLEAFGFLFTAMSNSFSVRSAINPLAKPAPRLDFPSVSPASAALAAAPTYPSNLSSSADRLGKTDALQLILSDKRELRPVEVFAASSDAVYVVRAKDRLGSAVAVSDKILLTNCHVVGNQSVVALEREGRELLASVVSLNNESDRCILRVNTTLPKWVKVRPYADIKIGERAFSIGTPHGYELTIAEGIVSSKRNIDGDRLLQTSAPISNGSSGGGLFDGQGNLLGITTWMRKDAQNLNFAIAAEEYSK